MLALISVGLLSYTCTAFDVGSIPHDGSGVIDTKMTTLKKDGRDPSVRSVFEEVRQARSEKKEHAMLTEHGVDIDVQMDMLADWNHVVALNFTHAEKPVQLIPTTGLQDMILMHKECRGCWSRHDARWDPDITMPLGLNMTSKVIDFMYLMHYYDAEISGHYWMLNTCLNSTKQACATNFIVYAVQKATPWFNTLGDGYLGLAPASGDGILTTQHNNVLEQMHFHGMINKKMFGVHTHMWNSTEDPSEIRFGGYNEELFKAGH